MDLYEKEGRLVRDNCAQFTSDDLKSADSIEKDRLPEFCQYRDEGCELANSCLKCPFPKCAYDQRGGEQKMKRILRDKEILRLFAAGLELAELAVRFGVTLRTIYRALRRAKK